MAKLIVDAEAVKQIRAHFATVQRETGVPIFKSWYRALTPVSDGGEAVPFDDVTTEMTVRAAAAVIAEAFMDPRAVEVAAKWLPKYVIRGEPEKPDVPRARAMLQEIARAFGVEVRDG